MFSTGQFENTNGYTTGVGGGGGNWISTGGSAGGAGGTGSFVATTGGDWFVPSTWVPGPVITLGPPVPLELAVPVEVPTHVDPPHVDPPEIELKPGRTRHIELE